MEKKLEIKNLKCEKGDCKSYPVILKNEGPGKLDLRIMRFKETGDARVFAGLVDDNMAAIVSEISALGMVSNGALSIVCPKSQPLGLDKELEKIIITSMSERFFEIQKIYQERGLSIIFNEQILENISPNFSLIATACIEKQKSFNSVNSGDVIYGFASDGQAVWEKSLRSGLESYGMPLAQEHLLNDRYGEQFKGNFLLSSKPPILKGMSVGEALTSPTRHYGILINAIEKSLKKTGSLDMLHGIILNTNNGAMKIAYSKTTNIHGGLRFFERMPRETQIPPIFKMIQNESSLDWEEMYKTYSCGIGIKIVGENSSRFLKAMREAEKNTGVKMHLLGEVLHNSNSEKHSLTLNTPFKTLNI